MSFSKKAGAVALGTFSVAGSMACGMIAVAFDAGASMLGKNTTPKGYTQDDCRAKSKSCFSTAERIWKDGLGRAKRLWNDK